MYIDFYQATEEFRHLLPAAAIGLTAWIARRIAAKFTSIFDRLDSIEEQQVRSGFDFTAEAKVRHEAHNSLHSRLESIERKMDAIISRITG